MELKYTDSNHISGWVQSKALWSFDTDSGRVGCVSEDRIHYTHGE